MSGRSLQCRHISMPFTQSTDMLLHLPACSLASLQMFQSELALLKL